MTIQIHDNDFAKFKEFLSNKGIELIETKHDHRAMVQDRLLSVYRECGGWKVFFHDKKTLLDLADEFMFSQVNIADEAGRDIPTQAQERWG